MLNTLCLIFWHAGCILSQVSVYRYVRTPRIQDMGIVVHMGASPCCRAWKTSKLHVVPKIKLMMKIRSLGGLLVCWMLGWSATGTADEGSDIYRQTCAVCHAVGVPGVPGVPKLGSREDWDNRLTGGRAELLRSVLKGKGAMPPKGGNASLSDVQARAALDYMLSRIEVKNGQPDQAEVQAAKPYGTGQPHGKGR